MLSDFNDLDADSDDRFDPFEMQAAMCYVRDDYMTPFVPQSYIHITSWSTLFYFCASLHICFISRFVFFCLFLSFLLSFYGTQDDFDVDGDGVLNAKELVLLALKLQEVEAMSVPGIFLLPPDKDYNMSYIQQAMIAFEEDAKTIKKKIKKKIITSHGKTTSISKMKDVVYHTFDRKEYMKWWSEEFHAYRDAVGDHKARGKIMRDLQLEEVTKCFEQVVATTKTKEEKKNSM